MIPIRLKQKINSQIYGVESTSFGRKIKSPKINNTNKLNITSRDTINPIISETFLNILIDFDLY